MKSFSKQLSFRWSDLDPNFHVHSAYYDFGAQHRIEILESLGLTIKLQINHFGLYCLEKNVFSKEIKLSDAIFICIPKSLNLS
jgi:acyl-CoA thioester hydrolase